MAAERQEYVKCSNQYETEFYVSCPSNQARIRYRLKIQTNSTIMVEEILKKTATFQQGYHEAIADELSQSFGGQQTLVAYHHGVWIKTVRSSNET